VKSFRPHPPSPALVVSLVATVVAMGSTSYAALKLPRNSVGAKQLKKNSVTAAKVKNQSLIGADLKLSTLGAVPLASHATHAGTADSAANAATAKHAVSATNAANATHASGADTVGGVTIRGFNYQTPPNGATATLFSLGGLTLTAGCSSGRVDATTSEDNAYISASWITAASAPLASTDTDFDTTEIFSANVAPGLRTGSIEYVRAGGTRVSVSLQAQMNAQCTVSGHAFASGGA
jgi:hypothetical protein